MSIKQSSILRLKDVEHRIGLKRSTIYVMVDMDRFPKPVRLGTRAIGWREDEIDEWVNSRIKVDKLHH